MNVLMVMWTDPSWYPALIYSSQILSEHGYAVHILYKQPIAEWQFKGDVDYGTNVTLYPVGSASAFKGKAAYLNFIQTGMNIANRIKPDIIIGYDLFGFVAASSIAQLNPRSKLIYHNFDLSPTESLGFAGRLVKLFEVTAARKADLLIFPSEGRAKDFTKAVHKIKREPLIIMNCQRLVADSERTGELRDILSRKNLTLDKLVIRLGSMGSDHGIEATIHSVKEWRGNWGLILVGWSLPEYLNKLRQQVKSLALEDRVVFLPKVPYSLWYDCLYSGDLGIALYELGNNINHTSMVGAGNKLNLYLKAGIPSIGPNAVDYLQFIERYHAGEAADPLDPHSIATAVNAILADEKSYAAYCRNAKEAFRQEFNFEKQFQPFLDWLMCNVAGKKKSRIA